MAGIGGELKIQKAGGGLTDTVITIVTAQIR